MSDLLPDESDCDCTDPRHEHNVKAEAMDRALATEEFVPARKCLRCDGRGWIGVPFQYTFRDEKCPACDGTGGRSIVGALPLESAGHSPEAQALYDSAEARIAAIRARVNGEVTDQGESENTATLGDR